jgi:hypothetical protein
MRPVIGVCGVIIYLGYLYLVEGRAKEEAKRPQGAGASRIVYITGRSDYVLLISDPQERTEYSTVIRQGDRYPHF